MTESDRNVALLMPVLVDLWEIRNPSAVDMCWKTLQNHGVEHFFKEQWTFLKELNSTDVPRRRPQGLWLKLYLNYRQALNTKQRARKEDEKYKSYSHYNERYNELLSAENLIIKEVCARKVSLPDHLNLNQILHGIVHGMNRVPNGSTGGLINYIGADDFIKVEIGCPNFLEGGRGFCHCSYIGKNKDLYIKQSIATLRDEIDFDFQFVRHFNEPFKYYLSLLRCLDESSIIKLMEDLLSDFAHPPDYYAENIKNVSLNPWRWGMPDIVAYDNENNFHILLECKGPNDRLSKRQIRWLSRNLGKYNLNVGLVVASEKQIGHL